MKSKPGKEVVAKLSINLDDGTVDLSGTMQSYKVRLAGVSFSNADGTNRQDILAKCELGEEVQLVREPKNPKDKSAIAAYCRGHQVGYVPAGDKRLAVHMDAGLEVFAYVVAIDGGPTFVDWLCRWRRPSRHYGCVIQIDKGYKKKLEP